MQTGQVSGYSTESPLDSDSYLTYNSPHANPYFPSRISPSSAPVRAHIIVESTGHFKSLFISHKENRMKKTLTAPVQLWQLVLVSVLVAILTSTAVVKAAPLSAGGFLTQGTIQIAPLQGANGSSVNVPSGYTNVAILQKTITIPAGKVADLVVMGAVDIASGTLAGIQYCFGQYRLDNVSSGTQFKGGNYILGGYLQDPPNNFTVPINGFLQNVTAGNHTVYMVMSAGYADCNAFNRTMLIFANIH